MAKITDRLRKASTSRSAEPPKPKSLREVLGDIVADYDTRAYEVRQSDKQRAALYDRTKRLAGDLHDMARNLLFRDIGADDARELGEDLMTIAAMGVAIGDGQAGFAEEVHEFLLRVLVRDLRRAAELQELRGHPTLSGK